MAAPATSKHTELVQSITKAVVEGLANDFAALSKMGAEHQVMLSMIEARLVVLESMKGPAAQTATHTKRAVNAAPAAAGAAEPAAVPKGKKAAAIVAAAADAGSKAAAKSTLPANARLYFRMKFCQDADVRARYDNAEVRAGLMEVTPAIKHAPDTPDYLLALASYIWDNKKLTDAQKEEMRSELTALKAEQAHSSMPAQLEADA
jgi:hypothetical protein